jgi:hypothetical protein
MAGATDLAIRIATTLDSTGIVRADKSIGKLQKSVKNFSRILGGVAFAAFAKKSLAAFAADEVAATRLTLAVKNLGLEFANPQITRYIENLEKTSQVADDLLRPAFQRLLQQTGSLAKSQSILNTAIEVSKGTGESLTSVSEDLAKAYYGQTRSLKKYSLGLTEAELKAKSFTEIQDILETKFTGSNAAYLNTYAGQLSILSLAWGNLQENAGKALFTLAGASGDQSSGARRLGGLLDAFGAGTIEIAKLLNNAATAFGQAYFGVATQKPDAVPSAVPGQELFRKSMANDAKLKAIEARQAKLYKEQLKATKALTAEQKKQALLKKAGSIFDLDQIQLIAALKGKLSDEDRKRVELQFALITGNTKQAQQLTYELARAQGLGEKIAKDLSSLQPAANPFASWDAYLDMLMEKARKVASTTGTAMAVATSMTPEPSPYFPGMGMSPEPSPYFPGMGMALTTNVAALPRSAEMTARSPFGAGPNSFSGQQSNIVVQIDGKAVASALQDSSLSGIGSSVNRTGR